MGLDAIECIHSSQDMSYYKKIEKIAKRNNLRRTGGSDFHGVNENQIDLGVGGDGLLIPEIFLTELCVR